MWYKQVITRDPDPNQRYVGKLVADMDYVRGDNERMINSPAVPEAKFHRRHNILLFHYVRSIIS